MAKSYMHFVMTVLPNLDLCLVDFEVISNK